MFAAALLLAVIDSRRRVCEECQHGVLHYREGFPINDDGEAAELGFFRAVDFVAGEFRFGPEVNVELRIVGHLDTVPVLRRAGREATSINHHFNLRLGGLAVGETVVRFLS